MNVHEYINRQKTEDRRAFIIYYPPKRGKTAFALRICATRQDAVLIDLQTYWLEHPNLPLPGAFGFSEFREFLLSVELPQSVIVVDNLDILTNTWKAKDHKDFINWLKIQLRSPRDTDKTFVFILQIDPFFDREDMRNSYGESRIQPLNAFDAI